MALSSSTYFTIGRLSVKYLGAIFPSFVCRIVLRHWHRTFRTRSRPSEAEIFRNAYQQSLIFDGQQVMSYSWGNGKQAILLGHGWNGRAGQFAALIPVLVDAGWKVIAFDAPGHGKSSGNSTSLVQIAGVVTAICSQHPEIKHYIGHSAGGMSGLIAQAHSMWEKPLFAKMVCIAMPRDSEWLFDLFCDALHATPPMRIRLKKGYLEQQHMADWHATSPIELVKGIDTHGLLIYDDTDKGIPLEQGKTLAENWKGSKLFVSHGYGHLRLLSSKTVIEQVRDFLKE